jgi:hypothetical protein
MWTDLAMLTWSRWLHKNATSAHLHHHLGKSTKMVQGNIKHHDLGVNMRNTACCRPSGESLGLRELVVVVADQPQHYRTPDKVP